VDPVEWINLPIVQGGAVALLAGVLVAIITGRLIPRWQVEELRESDQATITRQREEIREWKDALAASEAANRVLLEHSRELMETGRITEQFFRSATATTGGGP
jgi:hypothetical protein